MSDTEGTESDPRALPKAQTKASVRRIQTAGTVDTWKITAAMGEALLSVYGTRSGELVVKVWNTSSAVRVHVSDISQLRVKP